MSAVTGSQSKNAKVVEDIVSRLRETPGALLPILHAVQNELGYIPAETLPVIASGLNLSRAEVQGVLSFYQHFLSSPPGRNIIQICRAESCQAMGGRALEAHAKKSLKIDFHQTTADGELTLLPVYCLGNCACSPTVRVGYEIYGHVDATMFDNIVEKLRAHPVEIK